MLVQCLLSDIGRDIEVKITDSNGRLMWNHITFDFFSVNKNININSLRAFESSVKVILKIEKYKLLSHED